MSSRHFSHLSQVEIREIIVAHGNGEPKLQIAQRMGVDNSTVHYHIRKHDQAYPEQPNIYALIKTELRSACAHPSLKCALCGVSKDHIKREERNIIAKLREGSEKFVCKNQIATINFLRKRLASAHARLEAAGLPVE